VRTCDFSSIPLRLSGHWPGVRSGRRAATRRGGRRRHLAGDLDGGRHCSQGARRAQLHPQKDGVPQLPCLIDRLLTGAKDQLSWREADARLQVVPTLLCNRSSYLKTLSLKYAPAVSQLVLLCCCEGFNKG